MTTREKHHVNIRVIGVVQGVFFRASAKQAAQALGVTGNVRNNPDGSVSIEAEADEETLKEFIDWCWVGPKHAHVHRVEVDSGGLQYFDSFRIV